MADSCPTPTPTANPFRDKPFMCTSPTPPPILLCLRVQLRAKKKNQVSIVQSTQLWAGQHEHQCSDHPVPASRVCVSSNGPQTTRKIQIHRCIVTFDQLQFNALPTLPACPAPSPKVSTNHTPRRRPLNQCHASMTPTCSVYYLQCCHLHSSRRMLQTTVPLQYSTTRVPAALHILNQAARHRSSF